MTRMRLSSAIAVLAATTVACGQSKPAPVAKPAAAATTRPSDPGATSPEIMTILNALEVAGAKHATIQADVDYHIDRALTGEVEQRTGYVKYKKRTDRSPDTFRVHFDTLRMDEGRKLKSVQDFAFDGMWLCVAKHREKRLIKYQVCAVGQRIEPLRLGKGPFPLPFGQSVKDILRYFRVTQPPRKARKSDPPNADRLVFTTLAARKKDLNMVRIEQWIDRTTHLPVKVIALDKNQNTTAVTFTNVKSGLTFDRDIFHIPAPRGWTQSIKPLEQAAAETPKR